MLTKKSGLAGLLLIMASSAALAQGRAAAPDGAAGEVLATHICPIHGYTLNIVRPAGYPSNSDARIIQVEKMNTHFHATWNEVSNIVANHPPHQIDYHQLPQNPGPDGERYCIRTGHMIPIDTNVYQVSLGHDNNYNGSTTVFFDSNLELAPLVTVINDYNIRRDQGDALPPACHYGCLDGVDVIADDPGDGFQPGGYTTADGVQHEWELHNPDDEDGGGSSVGDTVRPAADQRIERQHSEGLRPAPGIVTPTRSQRTEPERQR